MCFVLANSADPNEMSHYATFHLGLHCLPKYIVPILGVSSLQRLSLYIDSSMIVHALDILPIEFMAAFVQ